MAQRYPIFQPGSQDNCYPRMAQLDQDLGYQAFISSDVNQVMPQNTNYQYEHVHRLQQPPLPYYAPVQNPQTLCLPAQQALRCQPSRLLPRKNRIVPFPSQIAKRLRIDGLSSPMQPYPTNTEMHTQQQQQQQQQQPQLYYQPMSQSSIAKYPLDTQSPTNSSPSRSPILNTSVSPSSTRDLSEEVKCSHHRHQPLTPAPISQTCYRPANRHVYTSPQSTVFTPLQMPAESTTSSPLPIGSDDGVPETIRQQPRELLGPILIHDEDEIPPLDSEVEIVSVKSPTVRPQEISSPLVSSPRAPTEEPGVSYQPYPQRALPLQQPQMQQTQTPTGYPVHNNNNSSSMVEQNQFFAQDYEYAYQPSSIPNCIAPVQAYFALPPQTEPYNIPVYPRPGTPTPFYACPQPILARGPLHNPRRIARPYEYAMPPYHQVPYHPNTNLRDFIPFEEPQGFVLHQVSHPHTSSRPKKQGLTKAELKRLRVRKYKLGESKDADESCVICMDEYKDGDKLYVLGCDHEYHRDCVRDWLVKQRNCPLCRKEVNP